MSDKFWNVKERKTRIGEKSCLPDFSEQQIALQKEKGKALVWKIEEAANDLSRSEFVIPAGDYGFENRLNLENLKRPDDNPLAIRADGVTFWMDNRSARHGELAPFTINNCDNIHIINLTVDEYSQRTVEGYVTEIDKANNRISIKLTNSSMKFDASFMPGRTRIVPFKANGDYIPPLYRAGKVGSGPLRISDIKSKDGKDEYWLTFGSESFINAITDEKWKSAYGKNGIIEVGDMLNVFFGESNFYINNSRKLKFIGFTSHFTNGMVLENGGYGDHLWKDCYFGPREGTTKLMSACEYMFQGTRHGTTLDNVFIASSSDDQINVHGFWLKMSDACGKTAVMTHMMGGLKGDKLDFYNNKGTYLGTLTLAKDCESVEGGKKVEFTEDIPESYKDDCIIRNPSYECDGWTIKNCFFMNNFQDLILGSGSGVFENNRIYRGGSPIAIRNWVGSLEGGMLGNITVKNNVFYASMNGPEALSLDVYSIPEWQGAVKGIKADIHDNLFVNCNKFLKARFMEEVVAENNIVVEPVTYDATYTHFDELVEAPKDVDRFEVSSNVLYSTSACEDNENTNASHRIDEKLARQISTYIYNTDDTANEIIDTVKNELTK